MKHLRQMAHSVVSKSLNLNVTPSGRSKGSLDGDVGEGVGEDVDAVIILGTLGCRNESSDDDGEAFEFLSVESFVPEDTRFSKRGVSTSGADSPQTSASRRVSPLRRGSSRRCRRRLKTLSRTFSFHSWTFVESTL